MVVLLPAGAGRAGLTPPIRDTAYTRGTRYPCLYRPRGPYWYRAIHGAPSTARCEIAYMCLSYVSIFNRPFAFLNIHIGSLKRDRR